MAISNPLLDDVSMKGARGVLINITGGPDLMLFEVEQAANRIRAEVDPDANIIFGNTILDDMEGRIRVSVVATGIDAELIKMPMPEKVRTLHPHLNIRNPARVEPVKPVPVHHPVANPVHATVDALADQIGAAKSAAEDYILGGHDAPEVKVGADVGQVSGYRSPPAAERAAACAHAPAEKKTGWSIFGRKKHAADMRSEPAAEPRAAAPRAIAQPMRRSPNPSAAMPMTCSPITSGTSSSRFRHSCAGSQTDSAPKRAVIPGERCPAARKGIIRQNSKPALKQQKGDADFAASPFLFSCPGFRLILAFLFLATPALAAPYDVREKSIAALEADMAAGRVTAAQLVKAYEARIAAIDKAGPKLNSLISLNPDALAEAAALDAEVKAKGPRGPLHGIPILIKDNIETADPIPTTAGSLALANNITHRDAPVVARLRAAGVVILGKTNLSEWANIRSRQSFSGWSGIGGLVKNPYALDRSTCGSSAGSAAAVAASLAAAALGTETNGSLVCPGSFNGIVALKPTLGLVSRTHIVPISHSQDTAGPMTRSVADAALLLAAMAGSDADDPATAEADTRRQDYARALSVATLKGKRLGVIVPPDETGTGRVFATALAALTAAGAEIVLIPDFAQPPGTGADEALVLEFDSSTI